VVEGSPPPFSPRDKKAEVGRWGGKRRGMNLGSLPGYLPCEFQEGGAR